MGGWSSHCSKFFLGFLDLSVVLVIVFLLDYLVLWRIHFQELAVHLWYVVFGWYHLMCLELYCLASVFSGVFLVFQGQKTILIYHCSNLIGKHLACSLKTSIFLPDLYHSFPIASLWRVGLKIAVLCKMIVFPGPCFAFWSLIIQVANFVNHVPEKSTANIRRMTIGFPMLAIRRTLADHDTQACWLGPKFCNIEMGHFYHGVVFDLRTWHRYDHEQSCWLFLNSRSQKKNLEVNLNLSFNLVKVRCHNFYFFLVTRVGCLKDFFQLNRDILYLT